MRKFKQETGYTLHNYIVNKRLLMARTLISNGMPVTKAAQESGFAEYSTFSRAYRKQFKTNPSEELPHYSNPLNNASTTFTQQFHNTKRCNHV